jgi:hypothetical protein
LERRAEQVLPRSEGKLGGDGVGGYRGEVGPGTREKVRSKRINLEGNTHAQEINVSQLPV